MVDGMLTHMVSLQAMTVYFLTNPVVTVPEPLNHFLLNSIKLNPCSKYSGKILLLGGSDNYWHFLMDDLSKLHFLKQADLKLNDFDTIFLNKPTSRFQQEYFDIFGIEYTSNNISESKEVKHLEADELCFSARFQPSFELFHS